MRLDRRGPRIPLPKGWQRHVRSAVLHAISLAQFAAAYTRGWAVNSINTRIRLKVETDRLKQEVAQLREEIRIKDARSMRRSAPTAVLCDHSEDGDLRVACRTRLVNAADLRRLPGDGSHDSILDEAP